jgi:hypothetical protein
MMANENARLAIMKQREVVSCLSQLSSVLKMGLNVSSKDDTYSEIHTIATGEAPEAPKAATPTSTSLPGNIPTVGINGNLSSKCPGCLKTMLGSSCTGAVCFLILES